MSHTTAVKGIKIINVAALQAAVTELNSKGVVCSLLQKAKPRAYSQDQLGMGVADYVLRLQDSPYDIGFYRTDDHFEPRTDFYGGHIERLLGTKAVGEGAQMQAKMGKLYHAYTINAVMLEARKKGQNVRRVSLADGREKLVVMM